MSEWVVRLLLLSFAASLLALLLFALQPLLRWVVSRRVLYILWIVVMVRMVVPFGVASVGTGALVAPVAPTAAVTRPAVTQPPTTRAPTAPASTTTTLPTRTPATATPAPTQPAATPTPSSAIGGTGIGTTGIGALTALLTKASDAVDDTVSSALDSLRPTSTALLLVWLVGALVSLLFGIARHRRLLHSLRKGSRPATGEEHALLEVCRRAIGVRQRVELLHADIAPTPFLTGIRRPILCLPAHEWTREELRLVLYHELCHLKHRDLAVKFLSNAVCALHWFNPAVYLIRRELSEATELACDESVSARLEQSERRRYGEVLLQEAVGKPYRTFPGTQALSESGRRLHQRLRVISQQEGAPRRKRAAGLVALLLLLVVPLPQFAPFTLTGCTAQAPRTLSRSDVANALRKGGIPVSMRFPQPKTGTLVGVHPTVYDVAGQKSAILVLYVFASSEECRTGVREWSQEARTANNTGPEKTFVAENVFLFVSAGNAMEDPVGFFDEIGTAMETLVTDPTPTVSSAITDGPTAGPTVESDAGLSFDWDVLRVDGVRVLSDPAVIDEYGFTPDGLCQGAIPGLRVLYQKITNPMGTSSDVVPLEFTIGYEGNRSVAFQGEANVDSSKGEAAAEYHVLGRGLTYHAFFRHGRIHMKDQAGITDLMNYLGYDIVFHADRSIDITTPDSDTPTPEPTRAPRYTMPKAYLKYIGFGTLGSYVMALAGHDTGETEKSDPVFFLEGGGTVTFTYDESGQTLGTPVIGITVDDGSGPVVRKAGDRTHLTPSDRSRFALQKGSLVLEQSGDVKVSEMIATFGAPISDTTVEGPNLHWEEKKAWHRSMTFSDLEIELYQLDDATDKDVYEIVYETSTDSSLVTTLGWRIGMSATDAIAAAESIDWYLLPKVGADGRLATLDIVHPDFYGYGTNATIRFEEDKVVSIGFNYVSVGS